MFWKCNIAVSAIDQIFEKETQPTLEELLEESEIIQELKSQNDKLISFITREENIKKIIEYLVDNEHPPFSKMSCEILISNTGLIDHAIFEDSDNLKKLWDVFISDNPHPDCLGRILNIFTHYASLKSKELYNFFIQNNIQYFDNIIKHIEHPSSCDLILRLVTNRMDEFCANYQEEFVRNNMASKLLDMISVDYSPETCLEAATTINELIRNIRTDAISDEMSLFELSLSDSIFKDGTINKLVDTISAADLKISNAISAATVLSNILNLQRCGHVNGDEFYLPGNIPPRFIKFSKHDFTNSIQIIEPLMNIIKEHQQKNSINVLNNVKNFGLLRLLVLEILVALILYNDENLAAELAKVDLPNFLMDLFEKFPENNLVHSLIELAISSILMGYRWKSRTGTHLFVDNTLISSLFSSDIFIKKILYLSTQRKNYIAHVREILRTLFKTTADSYHKNFIIEKNQNISESLKEEIMTAEANLHRIEEIEAIDTKFLRVISDDFDNQDTYFTNDIITQPYKTIENSIEYFTTEKTTKLFEDNVDIIEDRMCLNINTGSIPDPFSKMNIKLSKIFLNFEAIDGIKAEVEEQLTDVLKQEFSTTPSAWSNLQEDQISDERNDHSLTPTIKLFQHKTPSISSDYQNIIIDAKEDITIDTNLIKTGRCATSSPLSNVSADISGDESDAFENESTPQQT